MHLIDSQNASDNNEWVAGDPTINRPPTSGTAAWFNAIQFEVANYIKSQGIDLNKADNTQLTAAIAKHITEATSGLTNQTGNTNTIAETLTQEMLDRWNDKAPANHTHAGYASSNHTHAGYASSNHTHAGYASSNHTHQDYITAAQLQQSLANQAANSSKLGDLLWAGYESLFTPKTLYISGSFPQFNYIYFSCTLLDDLYFTAPAIVPIGKMPYGATRLLAFGKEIIYVKLLSDNSILVSPYSSNGNADHHILEIRGIA